MQLRRQPARAPQASLASQDPPCDPCRISENSVPWTAPRLGSFAQVVATAHSSLRCHKGIETDICGQLPANLHLQHRPQPSCLK